MFDHFGLLAPYYDKFFHIKDTGSLINLLKLPVKGILLDVGGGTGRVSFALKGMAEKLIVADISIKMLSQANGKSGLTTVCTYAEKLPFKDAYFDRVLMVDALHHVNNHTDTVRELWRVLKPGGILVIEEPDIRTFSVKLVAFFEKVTLMRSHFISPPEIAELFPKSSTPEIYSEGFNTWVTVTKEIG